MSAISGLDDANDKRTEKTRSWAAELERLSSNKIKATVNSDGNISEIVEAMDFIAANTFSQEASRRSRTVEHLKEMSVKELRDFLRSDCLALLYWREIGAALGKDRPKTQYLDAIVGDADRTQALLLEKMDSSRLEAIASTVAKPDISLSYCDGDREIAFEKASEGQRAAALLFMLLEQGGGPIIVDQPEGDLDNKIITALTDKLHDAKQNRQIIFASHNANIVVNGSSELVGHLDVNDDGERCFQCVGAIDKAEVRGAITSTMEGGKKAFTDRQVKYGY